MIRCFFLIFLFSNLLLAQTVDLSKLPEEKRSEILQQVKISEKKQEVSSWIDLGKQVADLVPIFAEKTGIAADKVLNSFSGKILLAIVLVHFFWNKIIGIFLLIVGIPTWWHWFKCMFLKERSEQIIHPNFFLAWLGRKKTLNSYYKKISC
jgi:hypothetical protein